MVVGTLAACTLLALAPGLLPAVFSFASPVSIVLSHSSTIAGAEASTLVNRNIIITAKLATETKIGSVTLTITPLTLNGGRYSNTQITTVKSTSGSLMNGVAVTMYENAGKSGGYYHGVTGPSKYPAGQAIEHDTYPGAGSYTEWSSVTWNGQTVLSLKITVIVP